MNRKFTSVACLCALLSQGGVARAELEILPQDSTNAHALAYDKVLIDDLELVFDASSPQRNLRPELVARLEEAADRAIEAAVGRRFTVVDAPGPGVLRVHASVTGIRAVPKRKRFWSYTPFGVLKTRVDAIKGRDFDLVAATVGVELYDGETGQSLAGGSDVVHAEEGASGEDLSFRTLLAKIGGWTHRLLVELAAA